MNDRNVSAVDLLGILIFEESDRLANRVNSEVVVVLSVVITADELATGADFSLGILDVSSADEHLTGDGVEGSARLRAEKLGRHAEIVVNSGHKKQVSELNVAAVLRYGRVDDSHIDGLSRGGDTLGDGIRQLGQRIVFAELNRLTVACGYRVLLCKAVVNERGLGVVDKIVRIIGLHLGRKSLSLGVCGDLTVLYVDLALGAEHLVACAEKLKI